MISYYPQHLTFSPSGVHPVSGQALTVAVAAALASSSVTAGTVGLSSVVAASPSVAASAGTSSSYALTTARARIIVENFIFVLINYNKKTFSLL